MEKSITSAGSSSGISLTGYDRLIIKQIHEVAEFFGFESRNKYQIMGESGEPVAYAMEERKGIWDFLIRNFLGHWRTFKILFFDASRTPFMTAIHPFRFFFQRLEIYNNSGQLIGAVQQRFSILTKRFDVINKDGLVIHEVSPPFWKLWTFPFVSHGKQVAVVAKKWSGIFSEAFTDRDTFMVEFSDRSLSQEERSLVLASAMFIDLQYFERKARS